MSLLSTVLISFNIIIIFSCSQQTLSCLLAERSLIYFLVLLLHETLQVWIFQVCLLTETDRKEVVKIFANISVLTWYLIILACVLVLQYYSTTDYSTTVLQHYYSSTVLQHYYSTTVVQYYSTSTVLQTTALSNLSPLPCPALWSVSTWEQVCRPQVGWIYYNITII